MLAFGIRGTDRFIALDNLKLEYHEFIPVEKPTQDPNATPEVTGAPEATNAPEATKAPDATKAPEADDGNKEGGCGASAVIAHVMLVLGAAVILKKKH